MGTLEIVLLSVAALFMAANQALKDSPNVAIRFNIRPISGRWNYLPLALLILATGVWGFRQMPSLTVTGPSKPEKLSSQAAIAAPTRPKLAEPIVPKITVIGLSLKELASAFVGRTDVEARNILSVYDGKSVTVSAKIENISSSGEGSSYARSTVNLISDDYPVFLIFEKQQSLSVNLLKKGESISAKCIVEADSVRSGGVFFQTCRLTDTGATRLP